MTEFTQDQMVHIIVLNADRLFDTRAQPGWTKAKLVEAIIEKAQMIVDVDQPTLNEYKVVGETILSYVQSIEFDTRPLQDEPPTVVVEGLVDTLGDTSEIELSENRVIYDVPTHTPGLISLNEATGHWEAKRDIEKGETEEEFNLRNAAFHKAERASKHPEDVPVSTPQQHLARVFGVNEK